jgi:hypothetical protein
LFFAGPVSFLDSCLTESKNFPCSHPFLFTYPVKPPPPLCRQLRPHFPLPQPSLLYFVTTIQQAVEPPSPPATTNHAAPPLSRLHRPPVPRAREPSTHLSAICAQLLRRPLERRLQH